MTDLLVVEDDAQLVKALALTLRSRGYDVTTAGTAADALRLAAARRFDVVVLDLGLPDRDGLEVIEEVRRTSAVPIVVLSARRDQRDKVLALDAGADDYLTKPFGMEELLARLRAAQRRAGPGTSPVISELPIGALVPGDLLELDSAITAVNGAVGIGTGTARVAGKKVCSCEFVFAIKDPD